METDPLLTVEEAATEFKLSTATIRRYLRDGELEGNKLGPRQWRIRRSTLTQFVNRGARKPAGSESTAASSEVDRRAHGD